MSSLISSSRSIMAGEGGNRADKACAAAVAATQIDIAAARRSAVSRTRHSRGDRSPALQPLHGLIHRCQTALIARAR